MTLDEMEHSEVLDIVRAGESLDMSDIALILTRLVGSGTSMLGRDSTHFLMRSFLSTFRFGQQFPIGPVEVKQAWVL